MRLPLFLSLFLMCSFTLFSQSKERSRWQDKCDGYFFDKSKFRFKLSYEPGFYISRVESISGLDSIDVKIGNCPGTAELHFDEGSKEEVQQYLTSRFP